MEILTQILAPLSAFFSCVLPLCYPFIKDEKEKQEAFRLGIMLLILAIYLKQ